MKAKVIISAVSATLGVVLTLVVSLIFKDSPVDPTEAVAKMNEGQSQIAQVLADHEDPAISPTAQEVQLILEGGKLITEGSRDLGMMSENPDFDACMVSTGVICGFDGGIATLDGDGPWDATEESAEAMYAHDWTVKGCEFDGTVCEPYKPDPWPPVDPSGWSTKAKQGADVGFSAVELALASFVPTEGVNCVKGQYAEGIVLASHQQTDNVFDDAVQGKFQMEIVDADFKLSGCTFPEPVE